MYTAFPEIAVSHITMAGSLESRKALVVYGSETGNAQDVAEELGRIAERLRFDTEVTELNAISLVCLGNMFNDGNCSSYYYRSRSCSIR